MVSVTLQVSLQSAEGGQCVCNDLSFMAGVGVLDQVLNSGKYGNLCHLNSRAKSYGVVFEESVAVKGVPFSLVQIKPP